METLVPVIMFMVVVIFLIRAAKVAGEYERLVVYRLGRYFGLRGPGFVILVPFIDKTVSIKLSDEGKLIGNGVARFGKTDVPVTIDGSKSIGSAVKIVEFSEDAIVVT